MVSPSKESWNKLPFHAAIFCKSFFRPLKNLKQRQHPQKTKQKNQDRKRKIRPILYFEWILTICEALAKKPELGTGMVQELCFQNAAFVLCLDCEKY